MNRRLSLVFIVLSIAVFLGTVEPCRGLPIAGAYPSRTTGLKRPSAIENEVIDRIHRARRARGLKALVWDPRLSAVAREHSEDMASHNYFAYASPRFGTLQYRLHRAGSSAANTRFAIFRCGSSDTLIRQLSEGADPIHLGRSTRIGLGIVRKGVLRELHATLILSETHSTLEPFPTRPKCGKSYKLAGRIEKGFSDAKVIITLPDGTVTERPVELSSRGEFSTIVAFDKGKGKYVVEVLAGGRLGPVVLDLMNCYAGVQYPRPDRATAGDKAPVDLRRAERDMLGLINRERAKAGLKELVFDERLAAVARSHSADMVRNKFFAHKSPTRGDLDTRMKRAGIKALTFRENLSSNNTLLSAHQGLMNSPGHRKNIQESDLTRVGIGIVRSRDGGIMVTQNFAQDYVTYDTASLAKEFLKAVNDARRKKAVAALRVEPALARIALENSRSMKATRNRGYDRARALLREARLPYGVNMAAMESTHPPKPAQFARLLEAKVRRIGVAIAQSSNADGEKRLWTTILFAE